MDRRAFTCGAMLVMLVAPPFAVAQRAERLPRIAIVFNNIPFAAMVGPDPVEPNARAIVHGLRDLGWFEGRNIVIERRSDEGRPEHMAILMQELVGLPVDVIVTSGPAAVAAQRATKTIPIVGVHRDPVSSGLSASLARPDKNFTGVSPSADKAIVGKLLHLLREVLPNATRFAMIAGTITGDPPWRRETETAARALGVSLIWVGVDKPEEFQQAFARIVGAHAEAVVATDSAVSWVHRQMIFDFALRQGLPAIYEGREYCESGGLMSYGTSDDAFQRLVAYVDKILKGAKPADLPIEQSSKYELVVNLKTAKAMGLTIPRSVLARADEVIR